MGDDAIKYRHFERFRPLCPRCRQSGAGDFPLIINSAAREAEDSLVEGILVCPHAQCRSEYPVVDGIPLLVADLRTYVSQNILPILERKDLGAAMWSLLGDCCGPGSLLDARRQHLSTYVSGHYGDCDPESGLPGGSVAGPVTAILDRGMTLAGGAPAGPVLDLGCSVGRTTFELAGRTEDLVLGLDLNFGMVRVAAAVLHERTVTYERRRAGMVYEQRHFPADFPHAGQVDFWVCDVVNLPFADATLAMATSMNLIDCVYSPYDHLREMARILRPGGVTLIATPYDWSPNATAVEAWIGGHSQRGAAGGRCADVLRSLFAGGGHPHALASLALEAEEEHLPWSVRLHDRCVMTYFVHLAVGRKIARDSAAVAEGGGSA